MSACVCRRRFVSEAMCLHLHLATVSIENDLFRARKAAKLSSNVVVRHEEGDARLHSSRTLDTYTTDAMLAEQMAVL